MSAVALWRVDLDDHYRKVRIRAADGTWIGDLRDEASAALAVSSVNAQLLCEAEVVE